MDVGAAVGSSVRSAGFRQMPVGSRADGIPLGSHARIREALEEVSKCLPITRKRRAFIGHHRIEDRDKLGQFGVRKSGMPVVNAMERLVK